LAAIYQLPGRRATNPRSLEPQGKETRNRCPNLSQFKCQTMARFEQQLRVSLAWGSKFLGLVALLPTSRNPDQWSLAAEMSTQQLWSSLCSQLPWRSDGGPKHRNDLGLATSDVIRPRIQIMIFVAAQLSLFRGRTTQKSCIHHGSSSGTSLPAATAAHVRPACSKKCSITLVVMLRRSQAFDIRFISLTKFSFL